MTDNAATKSISFVFIRQLSPDHPLLSTFFCRSGFIRDQGQVSFKHHNREYFSQRRKGGKIRRRSLADWETSESERGDWSETWLESKEELRWSPAREEESEG
jgi:hypothetical protein